MDQPGVRPRLDIRTPVFEGPLELLLALAEREEVDILEVSLSSLTEDYLREVNALEAPEPREMAEFLWLGSRLLLLKSVRLLPGAEETGEETDLLGWEEDVRKRLDEYRTYKAMAEELMRIAVDEAYAFPPPARAITVEGQEEPLEMAALLTAFQSVLERIPPRPLVFQGRSWTPEEKIEFLETLLERGPFDLVEVLLDAADRLEAVVTFVALLELLRRGRVRIRQSTSFGAVRVEPLAPAAHPA